MIRLSYQNPGNSEIGVLAMIERMMRELQSDLANLVESGDLTAEEANEWANNKAEQWKGGAS